MNLPALKKTVEIFCLSLALTVTVWTIILVVPFEYTLLGLMAFNLVFVMKLVYDNEVRKNSGQNENIG